MKQNTPLLTLIYPIRNMNLWNFVVVKEVMTPRHVTLPSRFHDSLINNASDLLNLEPFWLCFKIR